MTLKFRVAGLAAATGSALALVALAAPGQALDNDGTTAPLRAVSAGETSLSTDLATDIAVAPAATAAILTNSVASHAETSVDRALTVPIAFATLGAAVAAQDMPGAMSDSTECLAGATYFESKGEPLEGQLAVAQVILNRARSGRYPATVCGVVHQPGQFSFVRGGRMPEINRDSRAWREAVAVAQVAEGDLWDSAAGDAMAFHARRVAPGWRMKRVATIGNHVFYR